LNIATDSQINYAIARMLNGASANAQKTQIFHIIVTFVANKQNCEDKERGKNRGSGVSGCMPAFLRAELPEGNKRI
jgi:hypothetical protein